MSPVGESTRLLASGRAQHRRLADIQTVISTPRGIKRSLYSVGTRHPIVDQGQSVIAGYTDDESLVLPAGEYVVFGDHTRAVKWVDFPFAVGADGTKVLRAGEGVLPKFLFYAMSNLDITDRGYSRHWTLAREMRVPVPHLETQREIVRILDQFTDLKSELEVALETELEARRRQYEHYRNELLTFPSGTRERALGELARNLDSRRKPVTKNARTVGEIPYYGASGVVDYVNDYLFDGDYLLVSEDGANLLARSTPIAFSVSGRTWVNNHAHVLEFDTDTERRFVEIYLNSIDLSPFISGAAQPKLNKANLNRIPIPDPTFAEKKRIVALLDEFDALITDLSVALPAEFAARRKQYEYYRDKLLTFEELPT